MPKSAKFKSFKFTKTVKTSEIVKLPVHPIADSFPMPTDEQIRLLAEDMKKHGQDMPIVVCNGLLCIRRDLLMAAISVGMDIRVEFRCFMSERSIEQLFRSRLVLTARPKARELADAALKYYDGAKEQGRKVTLLMAANQFGVSVRTLNRLIDVRKHGKLPRVERLTMGRIPTQFMPLILALNFLTRLKFPDDPRNRYRYFSIKIKKLAQEILAEEKMQGVEDDWRIGRGFRDRERWRRWCDDQDSK